MDVDPPSELQQQQQPYAILRIKRKRNEEPLDALVVDSAPSKKRTRGGVNVFQYAETVEQAAWNDEQQKKELERRLAGLSRDSAQKKREEIPPPTAAAAVVPSPSTSPAKPPPHMSPALSPTHMKYQAPTKTYTILQQEQEEVDSYARRRQANAPPKVWSSKELEAAKRAAQVKMFEAVPSAPNGKPVPNETDAEIEKFLPMLKDYLNVNELTPPSPVVKAEQDDRMEDDYVYDVFYHRPATLQELHEPGSASKIAKLTGLPPELSGLWGELSDSDEEYDDEDDEDSNAEDWHTNDYPDEDSDRDPAQSEEELSDEFHEHSEAESVLHDFEGDVRTTYRNVMDDDF
ncbi:hypothetical protein K466DRAFT_551793 [Polyporus arcularius HHB13444]|uniref:Probable RNA polymerase II nuclear localization protein SLC7A6OS n=1 Tax=Polyporus arcularius HHB13444 TaxID=1314778 RepID=A0A5C3PAF6_9APHY|nr:hypothetical protein K466DRAFT_551793 [Polyporus arcularius HHB13444]